MRIFAFERRWARVVGRSLIPPGSLPAPADERDLGEAFAAQLRLAPWWSALVMRLSVWMVWFAPLTRLKTFEGLSGPDREALLERLMAARAYEIRELMTLLKLAMCIGALGDLRVLTALEAYRLTTLGAGRGEEAASS
jgi:hypothetical protein